MKKVITAVAEVNWLKDPDNITPYSHTFSATGVTVNAEGKKIIPSGTIYPANNETAIGIVFNDVDVTDGDNLGSLMVHGNVLEKRLPQTITSKAKEALMKVGIYFYADNGETLVSLPTNSGSTGS